MPKTIDLTELKFSTRREWYEFCAANGLTPTPIPETVQAQVCAHLRTAHGVVGYYLMADGSVRQRYTLACSEREAAQTLKHHRAELRQLYRKVRG